ncbi:MAG: 30S ribosomal protein S7 [Patescibacteria group bacterium]|nr:30S ribosomal protein S7 [Patescibacteria group bacterium]MDD5172623.1 30S ribosomal protein S7 [Patescibacteria group bacterium]
MRGKPFPKRKIKLDPKYQNTNVSKFINYIMKKGGKNTATKIVYQSFSLIKEKTKKDPIEIFNKALESVSPQIEVRSRRVGGANYQIPFPTNESRRFTLASRWIIDAARKRKGKSMAEKLTQEFLEACENQGAAIKKKEDVHRMAEANKAFAHFARY